MLDSLYQPPLTSHEKTCTVSPTYKPSSACTIKACQPRLLTLPGRPCLPASRDRHRHGEADHNRCRLEEAVQPGRLEEYQHRPSTAGGLGRPSLPSKMATPCLRTSGNGRRETAGRGSQPSPSLLWPERLALPLSGASHAGL
jgi:hypothetical protein